MKDAADGCHNPRWIVAAPMEPTPLDEGLTSRRIASTERSARVEIARVARRRGIDVVQNTIVGATGGPRAKGQAGRAGLETASAIGSKSTTSRTDAMHEDSIGNCP